MRGMGAFGAVLCLALAAGAVLWMAPVPLWQWLPLARPALAGPAPEAAPSREPASAPVQKPALKPEAAPPAPAAKPVVKPASQPVVKKPAEKASQVPVLLYHHITTDTVSENGPTVPQREFAAQMAWLKENGYTTITMADLAAWLAGEGDLPAKPVLITFDDGFRSTYQIAYPLLERYGFRATLFMVTNFAGWQDGGLEYLTWAEVQELSDSGVFDVQAHTKDGHRMVDGTPALLAWDAEHVAADLEAMRADFGAEGLPQPYAFAYPFGAHNDVVRRALAADGFVYAFTVKPGWVHRGDQPLLLPRQIIFPGTSMCRFAWLVTGQGRPCG